MDYICYMLRLLDILGSSFRLALLELWKNKLRTFLSLFGITIGIFCIIGVLATVGSLEQNIQSEIRSLGTNTIYIDKWDYSGGPDYPWWKYVQRPSPKYEELDQIEKRTTTAEAAAFVINTVDNVEVKDNLLNGVRLYGVTYDFTTIQPIEIQYGRLLTEAEFERGSNFVVLGNEVAEKLFGLAERAIGRNLIVRGKSVVIAGVIKKQGSQLIGGWQFDQSIIIPYKFARGFMEERRSDPLIMVKGKEGINSKVLKDELMGAMRSVRKLKPVEEENFSLNDVNDFSDAMSEAFVSINIGGAIIGGFSLIVGLFGVANIMFVSVKERTSQIGLKKALGAKRSVILTEFLLEAAFLCLIGGLIGLLLIFTGAQIVTKAFNFPITISPFILVLALTISIIVGLLAGIIPAYRAANLNPVEAIRST
jgi:putative ABC transport system permease protein